MKKPLLYLSLGLLGTAAVIPALAQKKGIFSPGGPRIERISTETQPRQAQPRVVNGVYPLTMHRSGLLADGDRTFAGSAMKPGLKKVLGDGTTLFGMLLDSSDWPEGLAGYGVYSFSNAAYAAPELVYSSYPYEANGGGCYNNGKIYWYQYIYTDEMGYSFATYCTYDFATKELTKNIQSFMQETFDLSQITNGMAFDPTTGKIYALAAIKVADTEGYTAKFYPSLSEVDVYSGFVTPIAQIPAMVAIACTPSGDIYTISKGKDAKLYRVNKSTGDCTLIGSTGTSANYTQGLGFDPVTGKLYWSQISMGGKSALYEVDPATGHADKIFDFGKNEVYTSLYVPEPVVAEDAPAAVESVAAEFKGASHSGRALVKVPAKTYSGRDLVGKVSLTILADGSEVYSQSVDAGSSVSVDLTLEEGIHSVTAFASNAAGAGPRKAVSVYVGEDAPAAVTDLKLETTADNKARISWTAPNIGRNDGYVDPAALTYTVTRYPDGVVVADKISETSFTDPVEAPADNYYYGVTAWNGLREGQQALTETGIFGYGTSLPCKFSLSSQEEFDLFTVIDANNDWEEKYNWGGWMLGKNFEYAKDDGDCAVYGYHPEHDADDWLITPPVGVEKGKRYRLTFTLWTRGNEEMIEVTAGPRNTIEAQKSIIPAKGYKHTEHIVYTQDFTAEENGSYFIGFHITSPKKRWYAFVSDIMVDAVPDDDAPAAVTDLAATAAADGAEAATISFTAPSATVGGETLASLDKIEIFHGNATEPVKTFEAPAPGEALSWTEKGISGWMDYRVVATARGKAGHKAEARVYVGWDVPGPVTDASVSDASGQPVVTWTAPSKGVNGGYINSDDLTYSIYRYEDDLQLIGNAVKGTSFTDTQLDGHINQHLVAYVVVPSSPAGSGEAVATENIVFGDPYQGEFSEDFADVSVHSTPWVLYKLKGKTQCWGVAAAGSAPQCVPVDDDGGMAVYSTDGYNGDEGLLQSPKLDISSIKSPALTFYFYHNYTQEHDAWGERFLDRMIPEVVLPDGTRKALGDAIYVDDLGTRWLKYTYRLDDYKSQPWIMIALHGITDCEQNIYVDHLAVTNVISNDLAIYSFSGNGRVEAGKNGSYKATVANRGAEKAAGSAYTVSLLDNGQVVESLQGVDIEPNDFATFRFSLEYPADQGGKTHSITARIDWADDEVAANNLSDPVSTVVELPSLSEVKELRGQAEENNVTLFWDKPDALRVDDSFEEHVCYEIENFGDYTLVDGDQNNTFGFQGVYFDNANDPQAFMVFNPVELGVTDYASSLFPYDSFDPRTGNKVLVCFQGYKLTADGTGAVYATNDDWFISPEVFGGQTISFWAKSGDYMQGLDKFEVMYSEGGKDVADFKAIGSAVTTDQNWTLHEIQLPANAKYFAIHCISEDGFVLMIDDLRFISRRSECPVELDGYEIFRDGTSIALLPASATSFTDNALAEGSYNYQIAARYADGRSSGLSNIFSIRIGESGLESMVEADEVADVFNLQGICVKKDATTADVRKLPAGVYIRAGRKIVVTR